MSKHRGHNEGSITHRKDGRWEARATTGINPDGSPKRVSFYGKTRREVAEKLAKALAELQQGSFIGPDKTTVAQWLDYWLLNCVRPPIRGQSTWEGYESNCRVHIIPAVGKIPLKNLKSADLQRLYNSITDLGRSTHTVQLVRQTVQLALTQGIADDKIHKNPNDATHIPPVRHKKETPLIAAQALAFLAVARASRLFVAFLLVLATGLRRGEVLALRWTDINPAGNTLKVTQTVKRLRVPAKGKKTSLVIGRPKTEKSKGEVPFPAWVGKELTAHRERQEKERGEEYRDRGLAFATTKGAPIEPRSFLRHYHKLLAQAGIPRTSLHNLRHTFATLLADAGEDLQVIQEILRHTSIQTTADIYADVTERRKKKAASRIGDILRPPELP